MVHRLTGTPEKSRLKIIWYTFSTLTFRFYPERIIMPVKHNLSHMQRTNHYTSDVSQMLLEVAS